MRKQRVHRRPLVEKYTVFKYMFDRILLETITFRPAISNTLLLFTVLSNSVRLQNDVARLGFKHRASYLPAKSNVILQLRKVVAPRLKSAVTFYTLFITGSFRIQRNPGQSCSFSCAEEVDNQLPNFIQLSNYSLASITKNQNAIYTLREQEDSENEL